MQRLKPDEGPVASPQREGSGSRAEETGSGRLLRIGTLQSGQKQPGSTHSPSEAGACRSASCPQQASVAGEPEKAAATEAAPDRETRAKRSTRGAAYFNKGQNICTCYSL